jgi:hypothetical protein
MAVIFSSMSGAIAAARAMTDPSTQRKLLRAVQDHLLASFDGAGTRSGARGGGD